MQKELEEIIRKNLPAEVGSILKLTLKQAEEDAQKVVNLSNEIALNKKDIAGLTDKIIAYQKLDERNSTIEAREKNVTERERNLEVERLKYQLSSEQDKSKFLNDVTMGLVRNTEYRKSVYDNERKAGYYDNYGKWIEPLNHNKSHEENKTVL